MNAKDAHVKKILVDLGLTEEPTLSPEEEEILRTALDPKEQELADMLRVLKRDD